MMSSSFEEIDDDGFRSDASGRSSRAGSPDPSGGGKAVGTEISVGVTEDGEDGESAETDETVPPLPAPRSGSAVSLQRQITPFSPTFSRASWGCFAEPSQTLIFFDWDDTLFPTTALCDQLKLNVQAGDKSKLNDKQRHWLARWQEDLFQYLCVARTLGTVVIVTNSRRPWVETTVTRYAPNLLPLFEAADGIKVVYAREVLEEQMKKRKIRADGPSPTKHPSVEDTDNKAERAQEQLMKAKLEAMRQQAKAFYKSYAGQSWKNILSLGDMWYEHEAAQELGFRRRPVTRERLRIKSILLPCDATLSEITLRLHFSRIMLPAYVQFDGDIRVDLQHSANPLQELSKALNMPSLAETGYPLHAWGLGDEPENEEAFMEALGEVALAVAQD
eukprot:gb/GFBE01078334.1/.p1 GENE.gb/GFBE01078334.1/~~gb/GFBE01078334.1/.p1  ORF type:complete len:389 (+),score=90.50 gb/GFBE01078334.1/:1-1167(+)